MGVALEAESELRTSDEGDRRRLVLLLAIFLLYGAANSLNHLLLHQFMKVFGVTRLRVSSLQPAYYFGYVSAAIPAAVCVRRWTSKRVLQFGLAVFITACAWIVAAAHSEQFFALLPPVFLLAVSVSALESTAGPYILLSAPAERGARRLCFAQSLNSVGMVLGATFGTFAVFSANSSSIIHVDAAEEAWRAGIPFFVLILVAGAIFTATLRERFPDLMVHADKDIDEILAPLRSRRFLLVLATAFIYMGTQICTWSFLLQYLRAFGVATDRAAGFYYMATLLLFALGRFLQTFVFRRLASPRLLLLASLLGLACAMAAVISPGIVGAGALVFSGLSLSVIYPLLFVVGVQPMGSQSQAAGSWMVCSLLAGGIVPPFMARIVAATGSYALGYLVPAVGFLWVAIAAIWLLKSTSSKTA